MGDLFGTTVAVTLGFWLTGYLSLWKLATGEWTVNNLRFGVSGPFATLLVAILAAAVTAPVFYATWKLADRRYRDRRFPRELALWLGLGIGLPGIVAVGYMVLHLPEAVAFAVDWSGGSQIEQGALTTYFGGALALALFPSLFTGIYHRLSLGDWTLRTRELHATIVVVVVVLASAVGAAAALAPAADTSDDDSFSTFSENKPDDPAVFRDGAVGPDFDPDRYDNHSYTAYQSGSAFACGEIQSPFSVEEYTPKQTNAGGEHFEIAAGQIATADGMVTLGTRYSVRLTNATLDDATILRTGYYNVQPVKPHNYSVGVLGPYDSPSGLRDTHVGLRFRMENVESTHVYVDVVRNGEIHRYVTTLCPQEAANGA
jgi:hypothetical protein